MDFSARRSKNNQSPLLLDEVYQVGPIEPPERAEIERRGVEERRLGRDADVTLLDGFFRLLVDQ